MIVGVVGSFLLLIVTVIGQWSRSARRTAVRSELAPGDSSELKSGALVERPSGRARMFLVAIGVLFLWIVGTHFWLPLPLAYRSTGSAQVAAFCVKHLRESQPIPGEYILIIEGSSATTRGIDGLRLEERLRAAGVRATVLQLCLAGANHLQRMQLLQNFSNALSTQDWERLGKSRLIFCHEVQALYDRDPLLNYYSNAFTAETLAYSNPDNLPTLLKWLMSRYDLRELWNRRYELQLIAVQFLYNALRISYLQNLTGSNDLIATAGFQPAPRRADFKPNGSLPIDFPREPNITGRQAYSRITRWNTVRDADLRQLFRGLVRSEVFFSLPGWLSYEFNYDHWWSSAHPNQLFFNGNRPQIRARLREPELWNDPGHLADSGAEIYTEEFAQFLKEHWLAQPG